MVWSYLCSIGNQDWNQLNNQLEVLVVERFRHNWVSNKQPLGCVLQFDGWISVYSLIGWFASSLPCFFILAKSTRLSRCIASYSLWVLLCHSPQGWVDALPPACFEELSQRPHESKLHISVLHQWHRKKKREPGKYMLNFFWSRITLNKTLTMDLIIPLITERNSNVHYIFNMNVTHAIFCLKQFGVDTIDCLKRIRGVDAIDCLKHISGVGSR